MYKLTLFTRDKSCIIFLNQQIIIVQSNRFVNIGGEIMATKAKASTKKQGRRCSETSTEAKRGTTTNAKRSNSTKACN